MGSPYSNITISRVKVRIRVTLTPTLTITVKKGVVKSRAGKS